MFDEPSSSGSSSSFMSGLAGAGVDVLGSGKSAGLPIPPEAAKPPPMFGANTGPGKKPARKSQTSFMSQSAMIPAASNLGSNTLLGQ